MISFSEDKADSAKNKTPNGKKERKFKPPKKITARYLYNSGLAYLQRFPASSSHFKSVMMRKISKSCRFHEDQEMEDCKKLLEELVIQFQEQGLLDDESYLKGMIISLRRRGLSSAIIRLRLQQKGYDNENIQAELQRHDSDEYRSEENGDYHAALLFARKKKLGPYDTEQKKQPEKSLAMMARAGYSYDIAKKALGATLEEIEENF